MNNKKHYTIEVSSEQVDLLYEKLRHIANIAPHYSSPNPGAMYRYDFSISEEDFLVLTLSMPIKLLFTDNEHILE